MGLLNTYIFPLYGEGIENALKIMIREYISHCKDNSIFNIVCVGVLNSYDNIPLYI